MLILLALACSDPAIQADKTDNETAPDLTVVLGSGEVRAGEVTDEAALFGGAAAEGRAGDFKIYNDRVQFVIQGSRPGDYYIEQGGGIIDADVVRPAGVPGRDVIDEMTTMVGVGRIPEPDQVSVVSDGSDGEAAVVRSIGHGSPMLLLTGSLGNPDFVDDLDVTITTDFVLEPDSWLLQVVTTVEWHDEETRVQVGDIVMAGLEVVETWDPGRGWTATATPTAPGWVWWGATARWPWR